MLGAKSPDGPRFARGQKFTLSAAGAPAEEAYRAAVQAARGGGRTALDAALAAWAAPLGVVAGDGVLLGELRGKPRGLADLGRALEAAGIDQAEVRSAISRLVQAGLVDALPPASQQPPPADPPTGPRW